MAPNDQTSDGVGGLLMLARKGVAVDVARDGDRVVSKSLRHDDERDVVREPQRGVGVLRP